MKYKVLLTTIPSDSHGWNLVFMQMFMKEHGCEVVNLGTCVPFASVIQRCAEGDIDLVVVSTVNGHGYMEAAELARLLGALPARSRFNLVIGGKLGILSRDEDRHATDLRQTGFEAVFQGPAALDEFTAFLVSAIEETSRREPARLG